MKINTIIPEKQEFLQIVSTIAKPPERLYVSGSLPPHRQISVAIVGSRKPTPYGREVTFELAYNLAQRGVVIISGLAYGIDAEAHRGALEAGGTTVAVLAHGLDRIYPATHQKLAERIVRDGALISEYEAGVAPQPFMFLARNRLVSGLADAIIVTEAAERSGTLATVTYALEQGREVFAVPGPITSPLSIGTNRLIQQGALPIISADDVLGVIAPHLLKPAELSPDEQHILAHIQTGSYTSDQLQTITQLDTVRFSQAVSSLEINGLIRREGGRWTS